jgi:cysteine-rich repeat protein
LCIVYEGCLTLYDEDCTISHVSCEEDVPGEAYCRNPACDEERCRGHEEGWAYCGNNDTTLMVCIMNEQHCIRATGTVCTDNGGTCVEDVAGEAECDAGSCHVPECEGRVDGDSFCTGDVAMDCLDNGSGCLHVLEDDCEAQGGTCDDSGGVAICNILNCDDHPACVLATEDEPFCWDFYFINTCTDLDADGCLELEQDTCSPGYCNDPGGAPVCEPVFGTGQGCADPFYLFMTGFTLSGDDFILDTGDYLVLSDPSCYTGPAGAGEFVLAVDVEAGQTVSVAEYGGINTNLSILHTDCSDSEVCLASSAGPDDVPLEYTASEYEQLYIIVEQADAVPVDTDYFIRVSYDPTCGNGVLENGETCDDWNVVPGDGCSDVCDLE